MSTTQRKPTWTGLGRKKVRLADALRVVLLSAAVLVALVPVVWTVLGSFKTPAELARRGGDWLPASWSFTNYTDALTRFDFGGYITNSILVTAGATILTVAINSMAAYPLAKYNFRGKNFLFLLTLATIMIPLQVILIPVYQVVASMGLVNSLWGMIIPAAATPTGVFLLRQYMLTIPDELIEAARVDGSGEFRTFLTIILPLCKPALAVVAIFSVMWRWNDFLWPLIVLTRSENFTLQVGLNAFQGELNVQWHYVLAMTVLTLIPITVVFSFLQRFITTGIASTGVKG